MNSTKTWNVYLSGEIHSDWRERIHAGAIAAGLSVHFQAPIPITGKAMIAVNKFSAERNSLFGRITRPRS